MVMEEYRSIKCVEGEREDHLIEDQSKLYIITHLIKLEVIEE